MKKTSNKHVVIKGESYKNLITALLLFPGLAYVFTENILIVVLVASIILLIFHLNRKTKLVFSYDNNIRLEKILGESLNIEYSQIDKIDFYKTWGTTAVYMIVTIHYKVGRKQKKLKYNVNDPDICSRIVHIARYNSISCLFDNDYTEMIIENGVSKIGKDSL